LSVVGGTLLVHHWRERIDAAQAIKDTQDAKVHEEYF